MAAGLTYFAEVSDIDTVNESRHQTTSILCSSRYNFWFGLQGAFIYSSCKLSLVMKC